MVAAGVRNKHHRTVRQKPIFKLHRSLEEIMEKVSVTRMRSTGNGVPPGANGHWGNGYPPGPPLNGTGPRPEGHALPVSPALGTQRSQPLSPGFATPASASQLHEARSNGLYEARSTGLYEARSAGPHAANGWGDFGGSPAVHDASLGMPRADARLQPAPGPAAAAAAAALPSAQQRDLPLPPGIGGTPGMAHAVPPPWPPPVATPEDGPLHRLAGIAPPQPTADDLPPGFVSSFSLLPCLRLTVLEAHSSLLSLGNQPVQACSLPMTADAHSLPQHQLLSVM